MIFVKYQDSHYYFTLRFSCTSAFALFSYCAGDAKCKGLGLDAEAGSDARSEN